MDGSRADPGPRWTRAFRPSVESRGPNRAGACFSPDGSRLSFFFMGSVSSLFPLLSPVLCFAFVSRWFCLVVFRLAGGEGGLRKSRGFARGVGWLGLEERATRPSRSPVPLCSRNEGWDTGSSSLVRWRWRCWSCERSVSGLLPPRFLSSSGVSEMAPEHPWGTPYFCRPTRPP